MKSIRVEGFKKISDVEIELADLNILVGANGSGKSSVLQAIHFATNAIRQSPGTLAAWKSNTIPVSEMDYLPTENYARLGHNAYWGNSSTSPCSKVRFNFLAPAVLPSVNGLIPGVDPANVIAYAKIRAARNAGVSIYGSVPQSLSRMMRYKETFFTAYIPGITGIPNKEQKYTKRVVLKAAAMGDSNFFLRNALCLLEPEEITKIEGFLDEIIGPISLQIKHDEEKDLYIDAVARLQENDLPLELLGTGYLQLLQIFCYVFLFKPKLLLIDEPDIHLHPSVQEALPVVLTRLASELDLKVILSTHSPFIVRGAPISTNVHWLEDGTLKTSNRETVELALGWGAFGKKIILVSEDANNDFLKKILSQWPAIASQTTILPGRGYASLMKLDEAIELRETLGGMFNIVVHRDRDSLTQVEVDRLTTEYASEGISLWMTDGSDLEAYFCEPHVIEQVSGCITAEANAHITNAITNQNATIDAQFVKHRRAHNEELYPDGGSPTNDIARNDLQGRPLNEAKGKTIFRRLKNTIPNNAFSEAAVLLVEYDVELASSLRTHLEARVV